MTTTRKLFTILASVLYYGHVLTMQQWSGVALVFLGLTIDAVEKNNKRRAKNSASAAAAAAEKSKEE